MKVHPRTNAAKIGAGLREMKGRKSPTTSAKLELQNATEPWAKEELRALDLHTRNLFDEFQFVESTLAQAPRNENKSWHASTPERKLEVGISHLKRLEVGPKAAFSIGGVSGLVASIFGDGFGPEVSGRTFRNAEGVESRFDGQLGQDWNISYHKRTETTESPVYLKATRIEDDLYRTETLVDKNGVLHYQDEIVDTEGVRRSTFFSQQLEERYGR